MFTPEALYRTLLYLLPRDFRREAGHEMTETFRLARARTYARGGFARLLFWPFVLADLVVAAWQERRVGRRSLRWTSPFRPTGDLAMALRSLRHSPGFALAAIVTFGLGIGVNLAVLSVVDRMVFRPLPYRDASRLVHLHNMQMSSGPSPVADLPVIVTETLRAQASSLEAVGTANGRTWEVAFDHVGSEFRFSRVSQNLLQVLGVAPIAGRNFVDADGVAAGPWGVILTDEAWRTRFDRAPEIIGRTFPAGRSAYEIVGVLPPGFLVPASAFEGRIDGVIADKRRTRPTDGAEVGPAAVARLRDGVDLEAAQAEADVILARLAQDHPNSYGLRQPIQVQPLQSGLFQLYRPYIWLIVTAVSLVFLTACANLSTLFLARGRTREYQAAIQVALGASRSRIVRSALTESLVLCLISAFGAVLVCYWTSTWLLSIVPVSLSAVAVSPLDSRLLTITILAALATAVVAGGVPALRASRVNVVDNLRRERRSSSGRLRGGAALLAAESAFGVFLVAGAAITVLSFLGLVLKSPGYEPDGLQAINVQHGWSKEQTTYLPSRVQTAVDTIRAFPGVRDAGAVSLMPVGTRRGGQDEFWKSRGVDGARLGVGGRFFATLRTPVLAGREFDDADVAQMAMLAIINQSGAAVLDSSVSAGALVGRTIHTPGGLRTIIGVVADIKPLPGESAIPTVYVPVTAAEVRMSQSAITIATRVEPGATLDLAALDARLDERLTPNELPISVVSEAVERQLQQPRFQALLFGSVAAIALLLGALGLFAVVAFDVARRRSELGIRMALGATAGDLRQLIIRSALRPVLGGTATGLLAAWWAASVLQAYVFEVNAQNPWLLTLVGAVLPFTAIAAAWWPAERAARTDPTEVLRAQ